MPHSNTKTEHKRVTLISRLSIVVIVLTLFYMFLDWQFEIHVEPFIYVGFIGFSLTTLFLIRAGKTELAKATGLLAFNVMIFLVASSEPYETGIHLHLFGAAAVALTTYDFRDWPKSLFFATLSAILFILVYLGNFSIIEDRTITPGQSQIFFVINAVVNASVCIASFLLYSRVNYQAEQDLRESEKRMVEQNIQLKKANKELDRFVYSVSHDLRAPLSSVSGLIQLIERSTENRETMEYLVMMKDRIARLEQFIRDIISFSQNERSDIRLESVDIRALVNELFERLMFTPGADIITLENKLEPSMVINLDRTRLEMVLSNLISNAIQYRNTHTDVCFIRFSGLRTADHITIFVEDNGTGIDPIHQPNVFNMFYRGTEKSKGSGLGLYIVKEAIEKMAGTITLNSVVGVGTKFTIALPVEDIDMPSPAERKDVLNYK